MVVAGEEGERKEGNYALGDAGGEKFGSQNPNFGMRMATIIRFRFGDEELAKKIGDRDHLEYITQTRLAGCSIFASLESE